ncbi:MAG: hypothetical protein KIT31_37850 [Deltaproteobacteria bacterium]|nr:hypothetical protein [Deltaproteobacteria bacterium]
MNRSIDRLVDVYYALRDPEELRLAPSRLYQKLLDDPVLAAIVENVVNQYRGGYVQLSIDAGATADLSTPGAVNAAIDASYELPLCRVVGVTASGLGGYEDGAAMASYAVGGTACMPLPANTVQVSYMRRDNVRTTLLARPVVLRDRRTDDILDVMVRFYRWMGKHNQIDLAPFNIAFDVTRSAEGRGFGALAVDFETGPVVWHRRGKGLAGGNQTFRFFQVRGKVLSDDQASGGREAVVANVSPLIVEGVPFADDVVAGLDLGWSISSVYDGSREVFARTDLRTEAYVATAQQPVAVEVRGTHGVLPTFGGQLVLEDRLAARAELSSAQAALRLTGFVGRAKLVRDPAMAENRAITVAGGGTDLAVPVTRRVTLLGRLELARSLAPGLAEEPARKQFDVRATVGVTTHFDRRW